MSDRAKIITIYVVVAVLSAGILGTSFYLREYRKRAYSGVAFDEAGAEEVTDWGELESDIELVNQEGDRVKLSELKDKVWVATNFFAACPQCAATSGKDLRRLYEEFASDPDFHIVSISVNPEDDPEVLKSYANALNADSDNWWFLTGPPEEVHNYVEKEMKFLKVTTNGPEAVQPFSHDYGVQVYARDWKRVKERDLHFARTQGEDAHEAYFQELRETVKESLEASDES